MNPLPTGHLNYVSYSLTEAAFDNPILLKGMMFNLWFQGYSVDRLQRIAFKRFGISADVFTQTLWQLGILSTYGPM